MGLFTVLVLEPWGDKEFFLGVLRSVGPVVDIWGPAMRNRVSEPVNPTVMALVGTIRRH